jgi:RND family efflux transporter MFP subunit
MRTTIVGLAAVFLVGCPSTRSDAGREAPSASAGNGQAAPVVETVVVVSKPLDTTVHLQGEITPYERVALFARVTGFVSKVLVDRGSRVKSGQVLVTLTAPELRAQRAEAEAKLEADKATSDRLAAASQTPGAVAGDEVQRAEAAVKAGQSRVESLRSTEQYLTVTAPFDGVITERDVHPGALVGPQGAGSSNPMLRIEQVQTLRLTVPVPETMVGAIKEGARASFSVRSYPGVTFTGVVKRLAESIDLKTRSMPVELDVDNHDGRLAPGMFADVLWPVKRETPSLFVPSSAIVQSTEKTFVVRMKDSAVEQVPVQRGATQGDLVEVFGELHDGDRIARRGTEELRPGMRVNVKMASNEAGRPQ